ncbi:MAG TPA: HNH endonuclease [Arcobacter sp.]|nr:HNH endonuclease [Arcobacter sp.]
MTNTTKAHFIINNNFQKREEKYFDILTNTILLDICQKITGEQEYSVEFIDEVNKGRLAILMFDGHITYISFSETEIKGRNASIQSFPTALVKYQLEENTNKNICFYFLPSIGNFETDYFIFIYRLMKTSGTIFLNEKEYLEATILPFTTVENIIFARNKGQRRNNNSTYLTKSTDNTIQVYGKTYGANKYETTLLCLALSKITPLPIELYQIGEGGLTQLPKTAIIAIESTKKIQIYTSNRTLEKVEFEENNSLRSGRYIYNLLEKLGDKKCAFCECEIPQIIQGAHIWSVSDIKKMKHLTQDEKLECAIDGDNGIWLCQNHHKLLDVHLLKISVDGKIKYQSQVQGNIDYIKQITTVIELSNDILTATFIQYLEKRNRIIQGIEFISL